jgi:hypothetical protein
MSKIRPRRSAEATDRLLAADGLIAQDLDEDEEEEEEEDEDEDEDEEEDSEDQSDGYSE